MEKALRGSYARCAKLRPACTSCRHAPPDLSLRVTDDAVPVMRFRRRRSLRHRPPRHLRRFGNLEPQLPEGPCYGRGRVNVYFITVVVAAGSRMESRLWAKVWPIR